MLLFLYLSIEFVPWSNFEVGGRHSTQKARQFPSMHDDVMNIHAELFCEVEQERTHRQKLRRSEFWHAKLHEKDNFRK